ncbi:MAG: AraC family transcriptional regulator [Butyricimonas paravirosa]
MENFQMDISLLPANEHEAYLKEGFNGICTGGGAVIQLFSVRYRISEGELITILPQQLVSISEINDDFSMTFFKVDKVMFLDIMSGLGKLTPAFFFYMRKNFYTRLGDNDIKRFLGYCRALDFRGNNDDPVFRNETILHLLRIYYWDHYVAFQKNFFENYPLLNSHKRNCFQIRHVSEYCGTHRDVALCGSIVYLFIFDTVIQEVNGQGHVR